MIDYYHEDTPQRHESPIEVDVRPALDSVTAAVDRIRMTFRGWAGGQTSPSVPLVYNPPGPPPPFTAEEREAVRNQYTQIESKCNHILEQLKTAPINECDKILIGLNVCMGTIVCPQQTTNFERCLLSSEDCTEHANELNSCLKQYGEKLALIATHDLRES